MESHAKRVIENVLHILERLSTMDNSGLDDEQSDYIEEAIDALRNCLEEI